mgnify:CR=1 FL=1
MEPGPKQRLQPLSIGRLWMSIGRAEWLFIDVGRATMLQAAVQMGAMANQL